MKRDLISSLLAIVVFTILLGVGYPLVVTGVARVAYPNGSQGSLIRQHGKVVGSRLLAQPWHGDRYFQPRPSQDAYNSAGTFFSNNGPNSKAARDFFRKQLATYLRRERRYDHGLAATGVPVDAVTTSASGVDPHISPANARIQAHRIAAVRKLPLATVQHLIDAHTDGRSLGVLGEPGVNVTTLNLALDGHTA